MHINSSDTSRYLLKAIVASKQETHLRLHRNPAWPNLLETFLAKTVGKLKTSAQFVAGSPGASVALRLLKERADSAEARAAAATRQVAELKASLQVKQALS